MAIIQTLVDCVEVCAKKGIEQVILCPGSRNAALIIAFEQNPKIKCYSISDERTAAFVAMGMANATKKTVAIVCTSGTAALNFIPAAAEAFFQEIPLLILTADRPQEWIDQYDGQTIFQENIFGKHVKRTYSLLPDYDNFDVDWFANRVFNEAINVSQQKPLGPVNINVPIREPFYPVKDEIIAASESVRIISDERINKNLDESSVEVLTKQIKAAISVWIIVGQQNDLKLNDALSSFRLLPNVLIFGDVISNIESDIETQDILFKNTDSLNQPDLLITCGKSLISKSLKLFTRNSRIINHWHIQETDIIRDPYQSVSNWFKIDAVSFFQSFNFQQNNYSNESENDASLLLKNKQIIESLKQEIQSITFSDISCVSQVLSVIEENSVLHLGNSLSVRYVDLLKFQLAGKNIQVECNRGTSGIEGTLSTAVGHALNTEKTVYCIIGDVSFHYDKNALWHNYIPANLKIIVLNNNGGNIFRMINGPISQTAYKDYFETKQQHSAEKLAEHYGVAYLPIKDKVELSELAGFMKITGCSILEFFTDPEANELTYKALLNLKVS